MTTCHYPTRAEAHADRAVLLKFGIDSELLEYPVEVDGECRVAWELRTQDAPVHYRDPMDLDETADYIDSHWDREAEDRELRAGRGHYDGPGMGSPYE